MAEFKLDKLCYSEHLVKKKGCYYIYNAWVYVFGRNHFLKKTCTVYSMILTS